MGPHTPGEQPEVRKTFAAALNTLVEEVKHDTSVVAAILCGSLSHDAVWKKSDIDLVLVTVDGAAVRTDGIALYADGVNVHALTIPRAQFRKAVEGSIRNSFVHSFLAKGRLLYTHDPTIADLCASLADLGGRDRQLQLLRSAIGALGPINKAHKWMLTRGDLEYTALWILYAATPLARIEVISHGLLADREVIPQAMALNPLFFSRIYANLLNAPKTTVGVQAALDAVDAYLRERATMLFAPVLEHLREVGEARSCTELENHFARALDVEGVSIACEYLEEERLLGKASVPVRLTKKSSILVQELAFFHIDPPPVDHR